MTALALLATAAYLAMAAVELPALWSQPERRGERWAVIVLLLLGLALAVVVTLRLQPPSAWRAIEALFKPIGTQLFKPKGG